MAIMSKTHWIYKKKYEVLDEKHECKDLGIERKVIKKVGCDGVDYIQKA
jgi:hypothetical protein